MPRYIVTLTDEERSELQRLIQKGGKGYRIRHAQILLKLDEVPANAEWTYDRIQSAYGVTSATIAGVARRFVFEGLDAALGRKQQENRRRKVTGDIEARIVAIACSQAPEGRSLDTFIKKQAIIDRKKVKKRSRNRPEQSSVRVIKATDHGNKPKMLYIMPKGGVRKRGKGKQKKALTNAGAKTTAFVRYRRETARITTPVGE